MSNTNAQTAAEGMSDYPRNPQRFTHVRAFFRKVLMPWHARAESQTEPIVQESFMNQHVDRRTLLTSSAAATAAFAAVVNARETHAGPTPSPSVANAVEHPDAELFRLEAEMEVASARLKKIERAQARRSKKAERAAGPRPLTPDAWERKQPGMPEDLWQMNQSALQNATVADLKEGTWRPAPVAEWQNQRDQERALVEAEWAQFKNKHQEQLRLLGYETGEPEFKDACDQEWEVGMRIFAVPAQTIDGMMVKLRANDRLKLEDYDNANAAHASIAEDIRRLAGEGAKFTSPEPAAAPTSEIPRDQLLAAYSEWLHFERLNLMRDIYPGQDMHEMLRYVPCNTRSSWFHFPLPDDPRGTWETMPSPATRALAVMRTVGVDLTKGGKYAD
ncbi:hypothetical protein EN780_03110 [Mesorhizobium sp. M4B.F.Ca.ET.089.01.1.1]|uniref:hypothetical protein n=1 Tax=Mesorhizobium sp. M4B.F.Ca.ET.089.01.1.1 TaxID=2496662 RepID=UPI000FE3E0E6|nr:hypothetical protein [Mesorhizobium sp. M4B.F.Ca.ET.089.01.1.1]RWX70523.1 hypothetical protein EN780_03110 [Mesorhizobium sp. M4B.F.Ca.ET.089.01.1.1]